MKTKIARIEVAWRDLPERFWFMGNRVQSFLRVAR